MKVLVATRAIPMHPTSGGMERAAWDLAVSMARTDDVTVLTTTVPGEGSSFSHEGVRVQTVARTRPGRYSLRWWRSTARMAVTEFDAVLSVSAGATAMIWLRRGPMYVFQAHGTASKEFVTVLKSRPRLWPLKALRFAYWTVLDKGTYRRADAVVPIGPAVTEALRGRLYEGSFKRDQLHQIANGINVKRLAPMGDQQSAARSRFGYTEAGILAVVVARLAAQKGIDIAIDAVALTGASLLVVGVGDAESALRRHAERAGVADRVQFVGELDRDGVRDALHAADVFLFTPRNLGREGLPLSVLESLAAKLPVIAPDGPLWPENIRSQLTIVDSGNAREIADAIARAHQLPLPHLANEYSIDAVAQQYRDLMGDISKARR